MFQAAIDAGVPVLPLALRYRLADGRDTAAAAFIGDETIIDSVRRTVRTRGLVLEAHLLEPIESAGKTRRELATLTETVIATTFGHQPQAPHPVTLGTSASTTEPR